MFLIMPEKIHPLWSTTLLPVFYLISSVAVGLCMTVVASLYSARLFKKSLDHWLLADLGRAASLVLFLYGAIKLVDISARGVWSSLLTPPWLGVLFISEMVLGVFVPAVLLSRYSIRKRPFLLGLACLPALAGVVLNRLTVSWFSMVPYTGPNYVPHWMELAVSATMLTVLMATFALAVKFLPVYPLKLGEEGHL